MSTDLLTGSVWFGVNLLLVRGAWDFCRILFPADEVLPRVLHTVVVCWVCITGMGTLLGALGILTAPLLLVGGTALALGLSCKDTLWSLAHWLVGWRSVVPAHHVDEDAMSAGVEKAPGSNQESVFSARANQQVEACWLVFWTGVLAFWAGRVVIGGLVELPVDWDTLMYHVPIIDHFLQTQSLYSCDCAAWYNPSNNELFGLWMVAPFSGDFLIALTNLPAGIVFVLATIELGRQLRLRGNLCHLTALAAVANFAVVRQLLNAGNDVPVASFVLAAFFYGLRYTGTSRPADLLFASLCLGLAAGIKYYALGPVAIVEAALVLAALLSRKPRLAGRVIVIGLVGILLGGGVWYLRNALLTGLPLYPKGLTPAHDPLVDMYPDSWRSSLLGCGRPEVLPMLEKAVWKFAGPCHYVALLLLPVSVLGPLGTGIVEYVRGRRPEGIHRLVLCFAVISSGLSLGVTPFGAETLPGSLNMLQGGYSPVRFGLYFYSLLLLSLALLLQDLSRLFSSLIAWVTANMSRHSLIRPLLSRRSYLVTTFLTHLPQAVFAGAVFYQAYIVFQRQLPGNLVAAVFVGTDLLLAGWVIRNVWLTWPDLRRALLVVLGIACCVGAGWATDTLSLRWHNGFAAHYDHVLQTRTISKLALLAPERTRICALCYRYYPLLASNRRFRVCQPKRSPNLRDLLAYLRAQDLTMVAVLNVDPFERGAYRDNLEWIRQNPRLFPPVHSDETLSLFRVNRRALEHALNSLQKKKTPTRLQSTAKGHERRPNSMLPQLHRQ